MFILLIILTTVLGELPREEPVFTQLIEVSNLANRTKSNISVVLLIIGFITLFVFDSKSFTVLLLLGTFVLAAFAMSESDLQDLGLTEKQIESLRQYITDYNGLVATKKTLDSQVLALNAEIDEFKSKLQTANSEKERIEKERDQCHEQVGKCDLKDCAAEVGAEKVKVGSCRDDLANKTKELEKKQKEYDNVKKELDECKEGKIVPVVNLDILRKKKIKDKCEKELKDIRFNDVLATIQPEQYTSAMSLELTTIEYELDIGAKQWIDSIVKRLRNSKSKVEFYSISNNFIQSTSKQVTDCASAVKAYYYLKYFQQFVDVHTLNRMFNVYSELGTDELSHALWYQLVHYFKSWFYVVEPFDYKVSGVQVGTMIFLAALLIMLFFNIGKIKRKIGELGVMISSALIISVLVYLFIEKKNN